MPESSSTRVVLKGCTWDHNRGYDPLIASSDAFREERPEVEIMWDKRSLHDFGAASVDALAEAYDLVVIDHPWVGFVAARRCFIPFEELVPREELAALASAAVGPSGESYVWNGLHWALAIDAATHVAAYRPDLLELLGETVPDTWAQVLELARRSRDARLSVAFPSGPVDAISAFLTLAANAGADLFAGRRVIDIEHGEMVLVALEELAALQHPPSHDLTPIMLLEHMSKTNSIVYCPLLYGYNNYARPDYRPNICRFANIPSLGEDGPRGSHLGGAGIAISSRCKSVEAAADYALRVASGRWQCGVYFDAGGQPAHRHAWYEPELSQRASRFFADTRESIERAFVRPRYDGYISFQYAAGASISRHLRVGGARRPLLHELDRLYELSLTG